MDTKVNFLRQIRKPRLTDIELVSMALTAEYLSIDSEYQLFRKIPLELSTKIERSVYNRRKRRLSPFIEQLQKKLSDRLVPYEQYFIVDSMPMEVCKLSRSSRSKICRENFETSPDKGYCASQKTHFFGYKMHAVCSLNGVFKSFDLTKASVHDIHYLKDVKSQFRSCTMIADKGYLSADYQLDLFESREIRMEVPMRQNQQGYEPQPYVFRSSRKRIETLLSQLCDQFMVRRNYAKTFDGFKNRLLTKITSFTIIQFINKLQDKNLNNIKRAIV